MGDDPKPTDAEREEAEIARLRSRFETDHDDLDAAAAGREQVHRQIEQIRRRRTQRPQR